MKLPGMFIFAVFCASIPLFSYEDLGSLKTARKTHPEIFIPGSVNTISLQSKPYYVFSGEAEQCFSGEFAEPESELYEEAVLSAKSNFFEFLTKGKKTLTVSMSRCSVLYRFHDRKGYTVILFVPKGTVKVSGTSSPQPVPTTPAKAQNPPSRLQRRIDKYAKRIRKDPGDIISYCCLARIYRENREIANAVKNYRMAIHLAERSEYFDRNEENRMILDTARLCEQQGKNNLALKYYSLLLKHNDSKEYNRIATEKIRQLRPHTTEQQQGDTAQ